MLHGFCRYALGLLMLGVGSSVLLTGPAQAAGALSILSGEPINPALLEKFKAAYGIDVTVTDPGSPDEALTLVRAGGHGMDLVMLPAADVPVWAQGGLLQDLQPQHVAGFPNLDPRWVDVPFDPGRRYTLPWQWGSVGVLVNTKEYAGDIDTAKLVFNPPPALRGRINVVPERDDVLYLAIRYAGGTWCTTDGDVLKKVRGLLLSAREHWQSMDYGSPEKYASGEIVAGIARNDAAYRAKQRNSAIAFGYPVQGFALWMDSLGILKGTANEVNARLFLSFVLAPENAAMISQASGTANAVLGSEAFMPADMASAEIRIPAGLQPHAGFLLRCPQEATDLYTAIWTEVQN